MTRAQMRRTVSCDEWTDWLAFYELEADAKKKAAQQGKRGR
jgi:hypothetical protein